jgi:hypothetical protein
MPTTYELIEAARAVFACIDSEAGVLTPEAEAQLIAFLEGSEDKIAACIAVAKRLEAEAELLKSEELRLRDRRHALENGVDRVRAFASDLLLTREQLGEEPKVKTPTYTAWLQTTESIQGPEDIAYWPMEWTRTKIEPDRSSALKAIKAGDETPDGFSIVQRRSVRWR